MGKRERGIGKVKMSLFFEVIMRRDSGKVWGGYLIRNYRKKEDCWDIVN